MTVRTALLAVSLWSSLPLVAFAKPRTGQAQLAEAKSAFQKATADYDDGNFEAALKGFERARDLSHNPLLFFNMAACAEKLNQARVAAAYLRAYLGDVPNADDATKVRERIGSLEERARQDELRRADEERRAEDDARRRKEDDERAKQAPVVVVEQPALAPVPVPAAPRESVGHRYEGGFIALGVTGAFGIVTAGLGGAAVHEYDRLDRTCGSTGCGNAVNLGRREAIATDAFIGLTSAAAITTVVLFALEAKHSRRAR